MESIGIYKIASPSGKVYIGQSIKIKNRWKYYSKLKCKDQPRLYNSLKKYGFENHIFEIIEECLFEQLDEKEIFYKQQFINKSGWENVLFCQLIDGKGGYKSDETKQKISKALIGKKQSKETCLKKSISLIGRIESDDTKNKKSKSNKGISRGKGIPKSKEHILKTSKSLCKPVIQYDLNGVYLKEWDGAIIVKKQLGLDINPCIQGKAKTSGGYIWRRQSEPLDNNIDFKEYLTKTDKNTKRKFTEQHKINISKSLRGRKITWKTK